MGFFGLKPAAASAFDFSRLHGRRSFAFKLANRNPVPTTTAVVLKVQLKQRAGKRYVTRTLVLARASVVAGANQVKPLTLTLTRASAAKLRAARGPRFTLALSTSAPGYPVSSASVPVRLPVARLP